MKRFKPAAFSPYYVEEKGLHHFNDKNISTETKKRNDFSIRSAVCARLVMSSHHFNQWLYRQLNYRILIGLVGFAAESVQLSPISYYITIHQPFF